MIEIKIDLDLHSEKEFTDSYRIWTVLTDHLVPKKYDTIDKHVHRHDHQTYEVFHIPGCEGRTITYDVRAEPHILLEGKHEHYMEMLHEEVNHYFKEYLVSQN
ncbi:MAG: hypothetical protein KC535_03270 [Nanoarchaeota archaeon]|nr:hypothetical protein [Nanoarchaeota archaeon]